MKITVGGVPEHFNYPWHMALKTGLFRNNDIELDWVDVKGGSGAMCKMLDAGELDYAVVLTEGVVKHIHGGSPIRIIHQYVKSPLIWGIHVSKTFDASSKPLKEARFARSRVGSGSHIMAYVLAEQNGWKISEEQFVTVGSIDGALEAFDEDRADVLLWEKFMTLPYVQSGKVARQGDLISPWPCFVLVANEAALERKSEITKLSDSILEANKIVMKTKGSRKAISDHYGLPLKLIQQWYNTVEWQGSDWISKKVLMNVQSTLLSVGIIDERMPVENYCSNSSKLY